MGLWSAEVPEVVRSERKDAELVGGLRSRLWRAGEALLGRREAFRLQPSLGPLSQALYYAATTAQGRQTGGEEYLGLVQVHRGPDGRLHAPSLLRRLAFLLLDCGPALLLPQALAALRRSAPAQDSHLAWLLGWLSAQAGLPARLHLALFYLLGSQYRLSRRLLSVQTLSYRHDFHLPRSLALLYSLIGALSLTQIGLSFAQALKRHLAGSLESQTFEGSPDSSAESSSSDFSCPLCLESKRRVTATPCGHIFCWSCIQEAVSRESKCPSCRSPIAHASRLCPVFNL